MSNQDSNEAEIRTGTKTIQIQGRENMNRAIHEDEVIVEIIPGCDKGRVVGVIKRNWRPIVATIPEEEEEERERGGMTTILVIPFDRRIPKIRVRTRHLNEYQNSRVVVSIDSWEIERGYPNGHIVKELGKIGRIETEVAAVMVENEITCPPFPAAILERIPENTPQKPWRIPEEEIKRRRDLRGVRVTSIDPPGCRDIDDALSVEKNPDGTFQVGVHIADPTYFIEEGGKN